MKERLDKMLITNGLVPSRSKAQELIKESLVKVNGKIVNKANYLIGESDNIEIIENDKLKYVSRAGLKLEKAIIEFKIDLKNKIVMDIGSSTGGFTDCSLQNGAKKIIAIDVGTKVMVDSLRKNEKVELHENTNFRDLEHKYFENVDFAVCDVSFISLKKIIEKIYVEKVKIEGIFLIKPQFECGKQLAKKYKGIITSKKIHLDIITELIAYFNSLGFFVKELTRSPIKGSDGNVEYLVFLSNVIKENMKFDVHKCVGE